MGLIDNLKMSASWLIGIPAEPIMKLLSLDIGGTIGSVLRAPYKLFKAGASLFGAGLPKSTETAAQAALREKFPNGSPGYF